MRLILESAALGMLSFLFGVTLFGIILFNSDPRFEADGFEYGRGSITLGCAFSYHLPPEVDSPLTGLLLLEVAGDNEQPPSLRAIVEGPFGITVLIGEGCKASINWMYFPLKELE